MASRSSLVVNARVHLPGSRGRSAVITNNIEYVATREGADKSATVDDLRRSEDVYKRPPLTSKGFLSALSRHSLRSSSALRRIRNLPS